MDCDDLDVGETRAWRCYFLVYTSFGFFVCCSPVSVLSTLFGSLLVVFFLFPLWHSICWSVFRSSF